MPRRTKSTPTTETFSIWTSFTDLMSNAFMVLTVLLLLVIGQSSKSPPSIRDKDGKPKIIELRSEKYKFNSGSAVLPLNLKNDISGKNGIIFRDIEKIIEQNENNNQKIDVIEVIGHTDGEEVGVLKSCNNQNGGNLDQQLEAVSTLNKNVAILCPGSNADLGLIRALAVVKELKNVQIQKKKGRFKQLNFRAYSAAQLLLPEDKGFAKPNRNSDANRRRIEIRFAQLGQYTTPGNNP
ncbi:MAG: flagellar motor protein [Gloeotrichia echinulata IR180]|jgi:hypothetical protein|nr:flagellar motor protein [Gloeotrichia echinulata DEX184]